MAFIQMNILSRCLARRTQICVLLPEEYNAKDAPIPVAYLLHGAGSNKTDWLLGCPVIHYVRQCKVAVVIPSCELSFYCNQDYGLFLDYIALELPGLCEEYFGITSAREMTYLAGASMGGYGTFKIGFTYPEKYNAVLSLGGGNLAGRDGIMPSLKPDGTPRAHCVAFHTTDMASLRDTEYDLYHLAEEAVKNKKPLPKTYFVCGTEDGNVENCRHTADYMKSLQGDPFRFEYREIPGGHDWETWTPEVKKFFKKIAEASHCR